MRRLGAIREILFGISSDVAGHPDEPRLARPLLAFVVGRCQRALGAIRQFLEQSVPVGDVFRLLGLQSPQKHPCRFHIVAASIQRCNHPPLKGDVLLDTLHQVFDLLQSEL
jgi:hypothetical protein